MDYSIPVIDYKVVHQNVTAASLPPVTGEADSTDIFQDIDNNLVDTKPTPTQLQHFDEIPSSVDPLPTNHSCDTSLDLYEIDLRSNSTTLLLR